MIEVLLFAELQEEIGQEKLTLRDSFSSVKELKAQLVTEYQSEAMNGVMTAVNEAYATDDTELCNGDIVAFIPPVSGG